MVEIIETSNNENKNKIDSNYNETKLTKPKLEYKITYSDSTLNVVIRDQTKKKDECFNIDIKFKIPNHSEINEIIYRLCSFKEEQFLMLEIQEIELITAKSTSNVYNLFKCLINYDEEFMKTFRNDLNLFIKEQNQAFYNKLSSNSIGDLIENDDSKSKLISYWNKILNNKHLNINDNLLYEKNESAQTQQDNMNMAKIYHSLIHSSQMLPILQRERTYAIDLNKLIKEKDTTLRFIMDEAQLDSETEKWRMKIASLKAKQQRNFRKFLQKLYDQIEQKRSHISEDEDDDVYELSEHLDSLDPFKEKFTKLNSKKQTATTEFYSKSKKLEESYTIQLGAQLKSTHNLRLIRCDIFDFCKERFNMSEDSESKYEKINNDNNSETPHLEPQAIQTAMSLYSDKLCALILLADNSFEDNENEENSKNETSCNNVKNWKCLIDLCEKNGSEFHFPIVEDQKRLAFRYASLAKNNTSETLLNDLNIGDFFITKHSNLSQVHCIFHLAANESKQSIPSLPTTPTSPTSPTSPTKTLKQSDLSSRHPVILGLRNILKTCISNNINTLTLPLLLTHEMNEEMTISWVMKRAELVLKCLKGFMIEFVQWGAQDSRTIQFVVPQGLMDETFHSLSNLIPTIFRESRTVNLI